MEKEEEMFSSSSEESQLTIAESPKKKKRGKIKQQANNYELSDEMKNLDKTIQDTIGKCKNLTSDVARKVLCKLVKNDHVLALALLKAEEEEGRDRFKSESSDVLSSDETDKRSDNEASVQPKMTRLKAKQLNKQLPMPGNLLDIHQPDEDVIKLIQDELKSDSEDEEYQPDDSDGDVTNTTYSDVDSQPSTPGSALVNGEELDSPLKSGEFKIPKAPLTAEEQENIARRTRSKLCLQTTSIETIESTFIPPDIDYDLYDFNHDFENEDEWEWSNFLSKYNLPLPEDDEKYDEADPEYIATESIPFDKEELKTGRVPKKELSDLISELFEDSIACFGESSTSRSKSYENNYKNSKKQKPTPSKGSKYPAPKISSKMYSPLELNTPPHGIDLDAKTKTLEVTPEQQQASCHYYYSPQLLQTPIKSVTPLKMSPQQTSSVVPQLPQIPSILVLNQNTLEIRPLADGSGVFDTNTIINQGFYLNGAYTLPQYQSVVLQVPTFDLLQNGLNFSMTSFLGNESQLTSASDNLTDDTKDQLKKDYKLASFDYLNSDKPATHSCDETKKGFTQQQNSIFLQQIQMFAQMLAVNYLQFYGHPFWWQLADKNKKNLLQLKEMVNSSHIQNCLELCEVWERELEQPENVNNKKYMEFLHAEIEFDQHSFYNKRPYRGRFHNRFMERVLQSNAILYPSLLPHCPFRSIRFSRIDPTNSELGLMALAYEHAYDALYKELNGHNSQRIRIPQYQSIVSAIIRQTGTFRSENAITKMIDKYKSHKFMNPIRYYFMHKKAPATIHEIIDVRSAKIPANLDRGLLPLIWEKYKFSAARLKLHQSLRENANESFTCADASYIIDEDIINCSIQENSTSAIALKDLLKVEIINDSNIPQIVVSYVNQDNSIELNSPDSPKKTQTKAWQKSKEEKEKNLTSILKKVTGNCVEKSPVKKKNVVFNLPSETPLKPHKILRNTLGNKFQATLEKFFREYSKYIQSSNHLIRLVFVRFRSFDIFWRLVDVSRMLSKKNKGDSNGHSSEAVIKHRKQITSEEYCKRINRKLADNRALIMQNAKNENSTEKECSYAHNFLEKIKKTLTECGDEVLYTDFMKILTSFNPEVESVPELYYKMEKILLPNYSDVLDIFLTFLLPEHAAEIGKFCEHFLLTKMSELIHHLNVYFQKQPSHMKKIYSCLNDLSNDQELTIEKLKSKILPLLKGNQLLIEWFMGIFETPADNIDDYETLHLKKPLSDGEICDYSFEELQSQEVIEGDSNNFSSCGVKFINGKIMYRSKTLLPAKISFLVNEVNVEKSPASKDEENPSNWCVHEIRKHVQFSDKRKVNENGDDERTVKKNKASKKFKVCDAQTLHAHAVRLNPIHAQAGEKVSDALQYLELNSQIGGTTQDSPKKQSKKTTGSPKKNLIKSPSSSSETSSNNQSPSPSKAILTTKKLRAIADDSEDEQQQVKKLKADSSSEESEMSSINIEDHPDHIEVPPTDEPQAWTRDEDKLMLEEIRSGKSNKAESINNLICFLEKRSRKDIQDRFELLFNLMAKISSTEN